MVVTRLSRPAPHKTDNDLQVRAYGRLLRSVFEDWLQRSQQNGLSQYGLVARLQQAAEAHFEAAYLRGKRQGYRRAALDDDDRQWLVRTLQQNLMYLQNSLAPDVMDKGVLQQLQGTEIPEVLGKSFGSRVEQGYGGVLWKVTEAGFRAGLRELRERVAMRFNLPLRQEEFEQLELNFDAEQLELAATLGMTPEELAGRAGRLRFGTAYVTQKDQQVCQGCADAEDGGQEGDGVYWEPSEAPLPGGDVCRGGGNCRCYLESVFEEI